MLTSSKSILEASVLEVVSTDDAPPLPLTALTPMVVELRAAVYAVWCPSAAKRRHRGSFHPSEMRGAESDAQSVPQLQPWFSDHSNHLSVSS